MKLELKGSRVNKCTFENNMGPNMKMNLQITTNSQIKVPKEFKKGSVGTILTKIMVGNPMLPLYMYVEEITSFIDEDATETSSENSETMMSLFKTICIPMANEHIQKTIANLCRCYNIPEIKIQVNGSPSGKNNQFLN